MVSSRAHLARFTGLCAGLLVCLFISFEAPFSGMSINPARSFASALPGHVWTAFWIYLTAPVIGMQLGTAAYLGPPASSRGSLCQIATHFGRTLHSLRLRAHSTLNGRQP